MVRRASKCDSSMAYAGADYRSNAYLSPKGRY